MEFKGTPGPWNVSNEGRLLVRDEEWQCIIADSIGCDGEAEEIANARLIAAAPDLLDALIGLLDSYKQLVDSGDAGFWKLEDTTEGRAAMGAINKALGRE